MKAVVVDPETHDLRWQDVADPTPAAGQVLVDIHATAVNRADLLQRAGNYPPPPGAPPYMGLEMAGTISGVGEGVTDWRSGDRVCALLGGGGYAEKVAVDQQLLLRLPESWDFVKAAAVPEVFYTAYVNLFLEAGLRDGESVLIHGGASGVGTAAIQIARAAGCRVAVTAGTPAKLERCRALGAEVVLNYKEEDFAESIADRFGGVDVILDIAGSDYLERNLKLLNRKGRLVIIALLTGASAGIDLGPLLFKRLRIIGSVLRSRSLEEKTEITERFKEDIWPLLLEGRVTPVIDTVLSITRVADAQQVLSENRNIGKVVMTVRDS